MRRLLALATVAAAVSVAPSYASGPCTGQVDTNCRGWVCTPNCFERDCVVWVNVTRPALCVSRPA